jgi:hypothetical protein
MGPPGSTSQGTQARRRFDSQRLVMVGLARTAWPGIADGIIGRGGERFIRQAVKVFFCS